MEVTVSDATYSPVRRQPLVAQISEHFRELVASGEWPIGTRIPAEKNLAQDLNVSRGTIREALRALSLGGLLESRVGDGTYVRANDELSALLVRELDPSDLDDAMRVREILETAGAEMAAASATAADVARMRALLADRRDASGLADEVSYISADADFHAAVVASGGNAMLSRLYAAVGAAMTATIRQTTSLPEPAELGDLHEALVDAIVEKNVARAGQLVHELIEYSSPSTAPVSSKR